MKRGLAVIFAVLVLASQAAAYGTHPHLDGVASWLAQRKVSVRCLTAEESAADYTIVIYGASAYVDGWVDRRGRWHPLDYAVFAYGLCESLIALNTGDPSDVAWAVLVLTHESGHLRGHRWGDSEALTQRWALRHFVATAVRLGATESYARMLLRHAVRHHRGMPWQYHADTCRKPWVDEAGFLRGCT